MLEDFIAKFIGSVEEESDSSIILIWELYVDGSSSEHGSGVGVLLISPKGHKIPYALRFGFKITNNEAEYEALLAGLCLAKAVKAERLAVFSDSHLIVCQIRGEYQVKGPKMIAYLQKVQDLIRLFEGCELNQVPMSHNSHADALAYLASIGDADSL